MAVVGEGCVLCHICSYLHMMMSVVVGPPPPPLPCQPKWREADRQTRGGGGECRGAIKGNRLKNTHTNTRPFSLILELLFTATEGLYIYVFSAC
jgi:hypothetical protein